LEAQQVTRIAAIVLIFLCTTGAWMILGATILARTYSADSGLTPRVAQSWGGEQKQLPPAASTTEWILKTTKETTDGKVVTKNVYEAVAHQAALEQSRIAVHLDLEQRQKGLLWFATYRVIFQGSYRFRNSTPWQQGQIRFPLPAADAIYDDLVVRVDGKPVPTSTANGAVVTNVQIAPNAAVQYDIGYRSQGSGAWRYTFGENIAQIRDFVLDMTTDFDRVDFPPRALSPTFKRQTDRGWVLTWRYSNLVAGQDIGMIMPEKLQPGPVAGRISFFAPVSLLFFFFLVFIITAMKNIELHPMHYFFLAASFFAFHLLLAYLVDHIAIHVAFAICSAVSIFLVVSYLRIVAGPRFAFVEAALSQLIYLVGFSYAFFFQGFTGLAVTIGAIVTLFVVMQMTARIDWHARLGAPRRVPQGAAL
jgi:inner membrane protein involved in colicin E2 resistance